MDELLKVLSGYPTVGIAAVLALSYLIIVVAAIYLVAFLQGREVSFWPPKVGSKPDQAPDSQKPPNGDYKGRPEIKTQDSDDVHERMIASISSLERENANLKARLTFEERLTALNAHVATQEIAAEAMDVFLARDEAVSKQERGEFLGTQLNGEEIPGGASRGYLKCSGLTTSLLKSVATQPKEADETSDQGLVVLVKEDYERSFKYSHSAYLIYHLKKVDEGFRIAAMEGIDG